MRRSFAVLLGAAHAIACSSSASPGPSTRAAQPTSADARPDCTRPSRLCDLAALAEAQAANLDALATQLYGEHGADILAKLRARNLGPLIVDPGIVLRLDEVLAFATAPAEDPWQVRARFAAHLGKVRVYRGMAVSAQEVEAINASGILSAATRSGQPTRPKHLLDQLLTHLVGIAGAEDTMLSVSYDPAVSRCVAAMYAAKDPSKTVHVWTVEVPRVDVLSVEPPHRFCPAVEDGALDCTARPREITPANRAYMCRQFYDPQVESFVQGRIDPPEITAVTPEPRKDDCDEVLAAVARDMSQKRLALLQHCK